MLHFTMELLKREKTSWKFFEKILEKIYCQKTNYISKMENENIRQSWEWETDFEQSFLLDIGEEEGLTKLLVNRNETAREPKCLWTKKWLKIWKKTLGENKTNWSVATFKGRIFKIHADGSNNKM